MDEDYSDPSTVESALKEWGEVFRQLPRVDAVFVPGGDPGHTQPKYLMALLEKQTANLRKYHPKAQMWVSPQGFTREWLEEFYAILKTRAGVADRHRVGPQVRGSLAELRRADAEEVSDPASIPTLRTACTRSILVPDWDLAYALT